MIDRSIFVNVWLTEPTEEHRARVISEHRYLCARAARRFLRGTLERADLEQVAAIGLIKAVDRYDASSGTPFEAYAWLLIVGELMHYVRDSEWAIRPPRKLRELQKRWTRAFGDLVNEAGREPSEREVCMRLQLDAKSLRDLHAYRNAQYPLSLDVVKPGETSRLAYHIDDQLESLMRAELFSALSPVEKRLVLAIYEEGVAVRTVAARLGYSRRHTTRMHRNALAKMRKAYAPTEER